MSSGQVAIFSRGLWKLRGEAAQLTGLAPVRAAPLIQPRFDAVAGWGHKPTASRARRVAQKSGKPYIAIEDGPLRSVKPGTAEPPIALVCDRSGIYYDSRGASDLTGLCAAPDWFGERERARAEQGVEQLKRLRLSKYNSGPDLSAAALGVGGGDRRRVLVLDQVRGDASVAGAMADAGRFSEMLTAARTENPPAEIIVKTHPAVMAGAGRGHFADLPAERGLGVVAVPVNPWSLLDLVDKVYTVSSGLGFEAALAGKEVVCFGTPFYAGWGFTDDRGPSVGRPAADILKVFAAFYLRYTRYFDPHFRREITFEQAAEQLAWLRDQYMGASRRSVCLNVSLWKRRTFDRLLDGPNGPALHVRSPTKAIATARSAGGQVVAWASSTTSDLEQACAEAGVPLVRVEDGFIRSTGLGAAFTPAQSLAFDERGIYYDPRRPSDLEVLLQEGVFQPSLVERARRLRDKLVRSGTTKYNVAADAPLDFRSGGRPVVLVPGQVEDDASVRFGSPRVRRNLDLLAAVRERNPDAFIVYKPHPDVEAGLRPGRIPIEDARKLADEVTEGASILQLIGACDRVETMTSLAGFEALIRGKPVTTHGQPFYAGWGLTEDLSPVASRTRRLTLDELVAATLLLYARYVDPVSRLRCGPEVLIERLAAARAEPVDRATALLNLLKTLAGRTRHVLVRAR